MNMTDRFTLTTCLLATVSAIQLQAQTTPCPAVTTPVASQIYGQHLRVAVDSDPTHVSARIHSVPQHAGATQQATLGVSCDGGGYANEIRVTPIGGGTALDLNVAATYGQGWQPSLRDQLHAGIYNPTQAGVNNNYGTPAYITINAADTEATISPFQMGLYQNPLTVAGTYQEFFVAPQTPFPYPLNPVPQYQSVAYAADGSDDNLDDARILNNGTEPGDNTTDVMTNVQQQQMLSEFSFKGSYSDDTGSAGSTIPVFKFNFVLTYNHNPGDSSATTDPVNNYNYPPAPDAPTNSLTWNSIKENYSAIYQMGVAAQQIEWTKPPNEGQSNFQQVLNSAYMGTGVTSATNPVLPVPSVPDPTNNNVRQYNTTVVPAILGNGGVVIQPEQTVHLTVTDMVGVSVPSFFRWKTSNTPYDKAFYYATSNLSTLTSADLSSGITLAKAISANETYMETDYVYQLNSAESPITLSHTQNVFGDLVIMADGSDVNSANAIGVFTPMNDPTNANPIQGTFIASGTNETAGAVAYTCNRTTGAALSANYANTSSPYVGVLGSNIGFAALLAPNHAYPNIQESFTWDQWILIGTPAQIATAVQALKNNRSSVWTATPSQCLTTTN